MKKSDSYHLGVLLLVYILKFLCNMKYRHDKGQLLYKIWTWA